MQMSSLWLAPEPVLNCTSVTWFRTTSSCQLAFPSNARMRVSPGVCVSHMRSMLGFFLDVQGSSPAGYITVTSRVEGQQDFSEQEIDPLRDLMEFFS